MPEVTNPQPKVETPAPPRAPVKKTGARKKKLVKRLVALGVAAAILGKSLYTGALDLKRCAARVQR